jgi:hypothetical protein
MPAVSGPVVLGGGLVCGTAEAIIPSKQADRRKDAKQQETRFPFVVVRVFFSIVSLSSV